MSLAIAMVEAHGVEKQLNQTIEELNELAVAVNHYRRGKLDRFGVYLEIADVEFMIKQLRYILKEKHNEIETKEIEGNSSDLVRRSLRKKVQDTESY